MYCKNCGVSLQDGAESCPVCGTPTPKQTYADPAPREPDRQPPREDAIRPPREDAMRPPREDAKQPPRTDAARPPQKAAKPIGQKKDRSALPLIVAAAVLTVLLAAGVGLLVHRSAAGRWLWEPAPTDRGRTADVTEKETAAPAADLLQVDCLTTGEISPELSSIGDTLLILDGQRFHFPIIAGAMEETWRVRDDDGGFESGLAHVSGGEAVCVSTASRMEMTARAWTASGDTAGTAEKTVITDIVLYGAAEGDGAAWVLPGGLTQNSTAADVLSVFGEPGGNADFGSGARAEANTLYYPDQKDSGISYTFLFRTDGRLVSAELSVPADLPEKTCLYQNEYFSVELPGCWTGRYRVEKRSEDKYEFQMKEGGCIFTLALEEPTAEFNANYFRTPLGTLQNGSKTSLLVFDCPSDDESQRGYRQEYFAMADCISPEHLAKRVAAAQGYSLSVYDYSDLVGEYTQARGPWELTVKATSLSCVTVTVIYVAARADMFDTQVILVNGEGRISELDENYNAISGTVRFDSGKVYLDLQGAMSTEGEIELTKDDGTVQIPISENAIEQYFRFTAESIIFTYGDGYELSGVRLFGYPGTDIRFQAETVENGVPSGKITAIVIENEHDLGGGVNSAMTPSEIGEVLGGTDGPTLSEGGSVYMLDVYRDGRTYLFVWQGDCEKKSDYVCIYND